MTDPYENLANAIVLRAVEDYRMVRRKLKRIPDHQKLQKEAESLETFFLSDWYRKLTTVNGELLLQKMKQEE